MQNYLLRFTVISFQDIIFSSRGDLNFKWRVVSYESNEDYNSKAEDDSDHWNPFADQDRAIAIALVRAESAEQALLTMQAYFIAENISMESVADDFEFPEDPDREKASKELLAFSKSKAIAIKQKALPEIPLFFVLPCVDHRVKSQVVRTKSDWNRVSHLIPDNLKQMLIDMLATCMPVLTFWFVSEADNMKQFVYSLYGEQDASSPFYGKYPYSGDCRSMEYMFYDDKTLDLETAGMLSNYFNIFTMIPVTSLVGSRSQLESTTAQALLEEF